MDTDTIVKLSPGGGRAYDSWDNIFFVDSLAIKFLHHCYDEGLLTLASPETEDEKSQIDHFKNSVMSGPLTHDVLHYCLIADRIVVSPSRVSLHLFSSLSDESIENNSVTERPTIAGIEANLASQLDLIDPSDEFWRHEKFAVGGQHPLNRGQYMNPKEKAHVFKALEPLIWYRSSEYLKRCGLTRSFLTILLDVFIAEPNAIDCIQNEVPLSRDAMTFIQRRLKVSAEDIVRYFIAPAEIIVTKAAVAAAWARASIRYSAALPIPNIKLKQLDVTNELTNLAIRPDQTIATVALFLKEVEFWPKVQTIKDVLRLKSDPSMKEFQFLIKTWCASIALGDTDTEAKVRSEISKANRSLAKLHKCQTLSRFLTYSSVPFIFAQGWLQSLGTGVTIVSVAAQAYFDRLSTKRRWALLHLK